ncbi:PilW family protein [Candidatus Omnitrophota bacterium]
MCAIEKLKNRLGFTLLETILVAAIFSVVLLAVYSTFSQGLVLWQRLSGKTPQADVNIFLEKISFDLRNSFGFAGIYFNGTRDEISFATLVPMPLEDEQNALSVGEVGYIFDQAAKSLGRWQRNYSQVFLEEDRQLRNLVNNVSSLRFQYYFFNPEQDVYLWMDHWKQQPDDEKEQMLPYAVRIELSFWEGSRPQQVVKTIAVAAGGQLYEE